VAGVSSRNYERAKFALAMVESGGDVSAQNPYSTASGKYQFTRAWDVWFKINFGRTWSSAVPSRRSSAELRLRANIAQDEMFDFYYQQMVAPWIDWVRRVGLGRPLADVELMALFHRQGASMATHFLRTGKDPNAGINGNLNVRIYLAHVRKFFTSRRQDAVKDVMIERNIILLPE